jgi:hypothetical protein
MGTKVVEIVERSIAPSGEMLQSTEEGWPSSRMMGAWLVYGILRDCAYRIKASAEEEKR